MIDDQSQQITNKKKRSVANPKFLPYPPQKNHNPFQSSQKRRKEKMERKALTTPFFQPGPIFQIAFLMPDVPAGTMKQKTRAPPGE
jgi:hypothetical protein